MKLRALLPTIVLGLFALTPGRAVAPRGDIGTFVEKYCSDCHDAETKKGGLDLTALKLEPDNPTNFALWVKVHDRVANGEMPPKKKARPEQTELEAFTRTLSSSLVAAEQARES